ncbi:MAG: heme-binding protein [Gammaproteobacteria bacterium]|nr:heme-binding protein [Gammaproteobacteria bacterium]MDH5691543.1 heme-binding protein [Gammaproteobacteria bacterium]
MSSSKHVLGTLLLFFLSSVQAEEKLLVIDVKRMTTEAALVMAKAALEACRKKGVQVGVTVVDRAARPQVVLRDVHAPDLTLDISRGKAHTAANFVVSTRELAKNKTASSLPGVVAAGGGLPITAGGTLLGAIGVAGAPSAVMDEACAQAGIDSLIEELEMVD